MVVVAGEDRLVADQPPAILSVVLKGSLFLRPDDFAAAHLRDKVGHPQLDATWKGGG